MFKISKKIMISGAIGNTLEMYDFAIWGLFSVFLAKAFLPSHSNLSDIFLIFLITYVFRPIGGLLFGILADQIGRKQVLTLSIIVMGLCTSIVGILPSYGSIGLTATLLLVFIRFFQVFSVGGEYISSIALLIESCDKNKKGYYGSWAAFGVNVGMMLASGVGAIITYLINNSLIPSWGWRFAFLISLITSLLGFWIRNSIPESYEFILENARKNKRTISEIFSESIQLVKNSYMESIVVFLLVLFGVSTTVFIYIFSPIYMTSASSLSNNISFIFNTISLAIVAIFIPFFGSISDKYGRIKTMSLGIITLLLIIVPYFIAISSNGFYRILISHILIAIPCACIFSVTPVLITEIFPLNVRCSITGFIYSVAACLGGGIVPILAFKLSNMQYGKYLLSLVIVTIGWACLLGLIALHSKRRKCVYELTLVN
ncbi:MFS transporter [Legionella drancourtii]|uniref:Major facilitator superfamily (MFS) profile domain-containing protein n=1 Tax=Legionella drancourtii LLAP12 TaxID=658187 RepID=G9EQD7_9GAMM|nr:MFS transporter [Legionella drancourtii]EHL30532.1 hypothetical protein LDG_7484 [Legionella drancourtii LLAP12]